MDKIHNEFVSEFKSSMNNEKSKIFNALLPHKTDGVRPVIDKQDIIDYNRQELNVIFDKRIERVLLEASRDPYLDIEKLKGNLEEVKIMDFDKWD